MKARKNPPAGWGQKVSAPTLLLVDLWRRKQPDLPGRPEAIRRLVELGLKAKGK
jgi:hypothetical protein